MNNAKAREILHGKKLKATSARVNLLLKMAKYGSAMSHSTIHKQMNLVDRVTLYRTIEILKEKDIIHKAFQEGNDVYYAICKSNCSEDHKCHEHIHFKCSSCNTIQCEEVEQTVALSLPNYLIQKVSINVEGICNKCYVANQ